MRQDVADCVGCGGCGDAATLGFEASILERSGRDDRGIGGGALPAGEGPGLGALTFRPFGYGSPSLSIPADMADLAPIGGESRGGNFLCGGTGPVDSGLAGLRGGSDGMAGGDTSAVITLGVDFADFNGALAFPISCVGVRFGGSDGSLAGSYTGAIILPESIDGVLDPEVLAVPFDSADIDDMFEMVEDTDSLESRLVNCCSEGLRGGKAGEGRDEGCLGGSRGGGVGFDGCCGA